MFFVFGREEKYVEDVPAESRTKGELLFLVRRVLGALYSPCTIFKAAALQGPPSSKGHGLG